MVKKSLIIAIFMLPMLTTSAPAQTTCSALPYNLTNGTTADATQVMANFNYLLGCINGLRGYIGGLTMSNDSTNPSTVIDTAAGVADSDDVAATMMSLSAFTKNANAAWAVGSGNGCLDAGSDLAANTWYHLFVIARTDTNVVDELCSTSATSPALPASYSKKRRIGSFKTDGSAHIIAFSQNGDEFLWVSPVLDVSANNPGTAAVTRTLTVPTGVKVNALLMVGMVTGTGGGSYAYVSSLDTNNTGAWIGAAQTVGILSPNGTGAGFASVRTNTSGQVRTSISYSDANTTLYVGTMGWIDTRGRFN